MGKKGVQVISLYLVLLAVFSIPGGENAHALGGSVEIKELEETIQLLEDPEASKRLATQLRGLLEAKRQSAEQKAAGTPRRKPVNLIRQFETYEREVFSQGTRFLTDLRRLPSQVRELKDALLKNWREYLPSALNLFIALLAGFLCWAILYRFTRRIRKRFEIKRSASFGRQVASLFVSTFFRIYPWAGLWIFCALFFLLFPIHEEIEFMVLRAVLALLFYSGLIHLIRLVLSPEDKQNRRVPFHDPLSRYLFLWSRRILLFSFWMYVLTMVASVLDRPGWTRILTSVYWVGWVILLALLLAQWRKGIENVFFMPIQKEDSPWKSHLKRFSNNTAGKIYLILLLYAGLLAALYVFGSVHTYRYLIYSTLKSLGALALLAVLWILWGLLLRRISRAGTALKDPVHGFERHVNRTIGFLGKLGYGGLLLLGLLLILQLWGVDVYRWFTLYSGLAKTIVRVPIIIVLAIVLLQISYFFIEKIEQNAKLRMMSTAAAVPPGEVEKRVSTLGGIFKKTVFAAIVVFAGMTILAELGFDIKPLLAGAGVLGLAVGFGAQNLIRDVISGLFLIFENRVRIGDVTVINGTGGLVEQVNLRTVVLRGLDGTVHVFPNGAINSLSNKTYEFSYYVFDVNVAYKEDTDKVAAVLKELSQEMTEDEAYRDAILEPLEVLGVDRFADSAVSIKARIKTLPIKQWLVGREMNRRIKKRFDELGIEIPFPHRSLYFGEASKSIPVRLEGLKGLKEEIKEMIREVLKESV